MRKLSKILCVVDRTSVVQPALLRSRWLAKATDASIELLICYYNTYLSNGRFGASPFLDRERQQVSKNHQAYLENLAGPIRAAGTAVDTAAVSDHPRHEAIARHAFDRNVDVILKDTHDHAALSRVLFSHTDWNLIRNCTIPLWFVKSREFVTPPKFVAAIDPLHANDKPAALDDDILFLSKAIAETVGGEVHAVHAFDPENRSPKQLATPTYQRPCQFARSRSRFEKIISHESKKSHIFTT